MARKKAPANQTAFEFKPAAKPAAKKPAAKARSKAHVKPVGKNYRPRTRKLAVGQSKIREGAVDPSTGRPKKFEIRRVQ